MSKRKRAHLKLARRSDVRFIQRDEHERPEEKERHDNLVEAPVGPLRKDEPASRRVNERSDIEQHGRAYSKGKIKNVSMRLNGAG